MTVTRMKITDLKIDGFGVWHDLTLRGLSPELTVFYGPNEAGKSTLMQFMRTGAVRRVAAAPRAIPAAASSAAGRAAGSKSSSDHGPLTISRYADRGPTTSAKSRSSRPTAKSRATACCATSLEHVDEPTYINIFAVGLREVQELNSLSDTAAAQWLYRLTSGLDRISLYDVIHMLGRHAAAAAQLGGREVGDSRARLAARATARRARRAGRQGPPLGPVGREAPRAGRRSRSPAGRGRKSSPPGRGGSKSPSTSSRCGSKRDKIDDQLERFAGLVPLEEGTLDSLDELNKRVEEHERQRDILKGQRQQLRDEAKRLGINDVLVRNGQRLEALAEQQEWLTRSRSRSANWPTKSSISKPGWRAKTSGSATSGPAPARFRRDHDRHRRAAHAASPAIEATEQMLAIAPRTSSSIAARASTSIRSQIESAMTGGEKLGLPKTVDEAGDLVAQLRRRMQVEQRIEKAREQAEELQQQGQDLVDEQVVPIGLFSWLLAVFVIGFVMMAPWYLMPQAMLGHVYACPTSSLP